MPNKYAWITGESTNIRVSDEGYLLTNAAFGDVLIEAPGVNDETDILDMKLNPATTTTFAFSNVTTGYCYVISNDGDVTIKYNINSDGFMNILTNESVRESNIRFTSLLIANAATTSCDLRVRVSGV